MSDGIYTAASGALARVHEIDVISNNLANASTHGFRSQEVVFREVLADAKGAAGDEFRQSVADSTVVRSGQGQLQQTSRPLDAALDGPGYFVLQSPDGPVFTRNGHFSVNEKGVLVGEGGLPVESLSGAISVGAGALVKLTDGGEVWADEEAIGRLLVVGVEPKQLAPLGGTLLRANQQVSLTPVDTTVRAGTLEQSTTQVLKEMTHLISVNRSFDAAMRAIETYKQIDSKTANGLGR